MAVSRVTIDRIQKKNKLFHNNLFEYETKQWCKFYFVILFFQKLENIKLNVCSTYVSYVANAYTWYQWTKLMIFNKWKCNVHVVKYIYNIF
jgi:hypothetical protein